jgi:hypothetical protein
MTLKTLQTRRTSLLVTIPLPPVCRFIAFPERHLTPPSPYVYMTMASPDADGLFRNGCLLVYNQDIIKYVIATYFHESVDCYRLVSNSRFLQSSQVGRHQEHGL